MRAAAMLLISAAPALGWRGAALPLSRVGAARAVRRAATPARPVWQRRASALLVATPARAAASAASDVGAQCPIAAEVASEGEMPKSYDFSKVEEPLYKWWESRGFFKPRDVCAADGSDPDDDSFTISMPPPNVTGGLHMGHAMFVALQDILTRHNRMRGKRTLWLPGTDHAGIATQMLVDRALQAEGISRLEIGREAFLEKVWEWKGQKGGYITEQIRRLGASCDWSREKFTLDPDMSAAVTEAFVRLHEAGLVYKGDYMCNWSPSLQTAVSDLEVIYSEEAGKLYTFKYELVPADGEPSGAHIAVATTRPETILGDTAVCVHPEDERYRPLVGRTVKVPFVGREIPVIADEYVDMEFGTGALKITPAHDINDYEIGKRHELPLITVLGKDAAVTAEGGPYAGLDRYEARSKLWADMEAAGLAISVEDHTQRVPRSERSGEVIEPLVSTQWFVRAAPLAAPALAKVRSGEVRIIPERFEKVYFNWLDNIQDWCISRQLWWGHRIPVWYAKDPAAPGGQRPFVARSEADAHAQAREALGVAEVELEQDPDVLDTWFSSGLWPFSTLGWPQQTADLAAFYPTQVMETGYDILFFWVARMMMMGIELTGQAPFSTVYMHGLVRDEKGQKMSKTKGNVVDPLETIAEFGTDALRYALVTGSTPGQDIPLSPEKLLGARNLANKLWNTCRFLVTGSLAQLDEAQRGALAVEAPMGADELSGLSLPERYIVSRAHELATSVTASLDESVMGAAGSSVARFLWDEYADWYIEVSKTRFQAGEGEDADAARRTLVYVLDTSLRLLHPFMPYVTETLWQRLPHAGESIMTAAWPVARGQPGLPVDAQAIAQFTTFQDAVRAVRNARAEFKVEPAKKIAATVCIADGATYDALRAEAAAFALLARVDPAGLEFSAQLRAPEGAGKTVHLVIADGVEVFLPLANLVDYAQEKARLEKQATKLQASIDKLRTRLDAPGFADKAPVKVVEQARQELAEQQEQLETVTKSLADLPAAE